MITCAIGYHHTDEAVDDGVLRIARYAHGDDYHDVVRRLLEQVAQLIRTKWGGETRVCVDTAPIHERYWAVASGLGSRTASGLVMVPGLGTQCFLGEILTTVHFAPTDNEPPIHGCDTCGACVTRCPGGAINPNGTVDARRCLSYLTIEHRGELPDELTTGGRLYGCDECQSVCHLNSGIAPCRHPEFSMRVAYKKLTPDVIAEMTPEVYASTFRHSAIKRAKLAMLQRNALKAGRCAR